MAIENLPLFSAMNREEVKPPFPHPHRPLTSQESHFAIMEKVNACIAEVNHFEQRVKFAMEKFFERTNTENDAFKEAIQASYNAFQEVIQNEVNNFEADIQNNYDLFRNDIDTRIASFQTAINNDFVSLQESLTTVVNNKIAEIEADYSTVKSDLISTSNAKLAELEQIRVTLLEEFRLYKNTLQGEYDAFSTNIRNYVESHMEEQDGKIEEYKEYMVDNILDSTRTIFNQKANNGEITALMQEVYGSTRTFKGALTYEEIIALTDAENGDYYYCTNDEHYYQRTETAWIDIGNGDRIADEFDVFKANVTENTASIEELKTSGEVYSVAVDDLTFFRGYYDELGNTDRVDRISCENYIPLSSLKHIKLSEGYRVAVCCYSEGSYYHGYVGFYGSGETITKEKILRDIKTSRFSEMYERIKYVRFVFRNTNGTELDLEADLVLANVEVKRNELFPSIRNAKVMYYGVIHYSTETGLLTIKSNDTENRDVYIALNDGTNEDIVSFANLGSFSHEILPRTNGDSNIYLMWSVTKKQFIHSYRTRYGFTGEKPSYNNVLIAVFFLSHSGKIIKNVISNLNIVVDEKYVMNTTQTQSRNISPNYACFFSKGISLHIDTVTEGNDTTITARLENNLGYGHVISANKLSRCQKSYETTLTIGGKFLADIYFDTENDKLHITDERPSEGYNSLNVHGNLLASYIHYDGEIIKCDERLKSKIYLNGMIANVNEFSPLSGKTVAVIGDSISTNGNEGVDSNVVEMTITDADVGVELSAYLTYYDVQNGLILGGHAFTDVEIGTEVTFTPNTSDVGKVIGVPNNYNGNNTKTWWEVAQEEMQFKTIPVCWSGSSITSHEESTTTRKCSHAWHESQIRKCGKRVEGTMDRIAPDVIIIYRVTNDFSHAPYTQLTENYFDGVNWSYPDTDLLENGKYGFIEGYCLTIKKLREAYPSAKIFVCTPNVFKRVNYSHYPTNNGLNTLPQYTKAIKEIADFMGCGVIEFDKCGITFENCYSEGYITDSETIPTHPSNKGHYAMGQKAITDLKAQYSHIQ